MKTRKTGELSYIFSPFSDDEISLIRRDVETVPDHQPLHARPAERRGGREMFISFGEKFDVERYDIEVDFDPARLYLSARARITVRAQIDAVDSLKFNFNPALDILRVFDAEGRELFFTQDKFREAPLRLFSRSRPARRRAPRSKCITAASSRSRRSRPTSSPAARSSSTVDPAPLRDLPLQPVLPVVSRAGRERLLPGRDLVQRPAGVLPPHQRSVPRGRHGGIRPPDRRPGQGREQDLPL